MGVVFQNGPAAGKRRTALSAARRFAVAAAMLLAGASAARADAPGPSVPDASPEAAAASAPVAQLCDPAASPYPKLAARSDCSTLAAELSGLQEVTLEFSDRYQAVAVPIQVYTMSWVTHVDFVLPDGRLLGATPFGVRIRDWTPPIHAVRYTFHADAEKVLGFALSQVGKPYDYIGLSGFALKLGFLHQPGSWFCSALVEAAALQDGVDLSGKSPRMTSPARIKDSALLTKLGAQPALATAQTDSSPPPPPPADPSVPAPSPATGG